MLNRTEHTGEGDVLSEGDAYPVPGSGRVIFP
jgi:hypothetical protein